MKSEIDIRAIAEIARLGSFVRAAESLSLTQPSLSRRLQRIEREVGAELFDRSVRNVKPTAFGETAIAHAEKLLRAFDDLQHNIRLLHDLARGEVAIATTMYPAQISVARAVGELIRRHSRLQVHLTIDPQPVAAQKLKEGEVDIGVFWISDEAERSHFYSGLEVTRMKRRKHVFYCRAGHPLAMFPEATPAQIVHYPFVGCQMHRLTPPFEDCDLDVSGSICPETGAFIPRILVDSFTSARAVVASSDAVSWAPMCLLTDMLADKRIVPLSYAHDDFVCSYDLVWPADRVLSPAGRAFVDLVAEVDAGID